MTHLRNKRILITGAGHGLGREFAKSFGAAGCEVIVTDRDTDRVADAVAWLAKSNIAAFGYAMDVTNPANVRHVHEHVRAERGPIDILVNNAGIVSGGTFEHLPLERHKAIYDVNCLGPVNVTHTLLTALIARPESHIVNIASACALLPLPFAATYASSKWAVLGFSESLLEELRLTGHDHVHVTTVCPGYIATGMFSGVKIPFLMPMLTPHTLAERVVRAVRSDCEVLRTPWQVKLLPLMMALLPRGLQRWLGDHLGVLDSMQTWRGLAEPARVAKEPSPPAPTDAVPRVLS
ncbi:MAG TPA: SDR family NAD(P)-dependent oxidoreductase, partial [Planctomycetaceae bacterium]|nr:SDR family NAD(P)-dependent oxidoreductase [Planctomycetaceae bacterium]